MIDGQNFFNQPVKNNLITFKNGNKVTLKLLSNVAGVF